MSRRHDSAAARRERNGYHVEQIARSHRATLSGIATTLKRRASAARSVSLGSITIQLTAGEAVLIASALTDWIRDREDAAETAARDARKGGTP